jgi:hypothetical protein
MCLWLVQAMLETIHQFNQPTTRILSRCIAIENLPPGAQKSSGATISPMLRADAQESGPVMAPMLDNGS